MYRLQVPIRTIALQKHRGYINPCFAIVIFFLFVISAQQNVLAQCTAPTVNVTPASANFCEGGSVTLTASGATNYTWSPSTGLNFSVNATVVASPTVTTTYTVVGTVAGGCSAIKTVVVSVKPKPVISYVANSTSCSFDNPGGGIDVSVAGGVAPYTYLWSNGSTTQDISDVLWGNYGLTVTGANGCTASTVISLSSSGGPQFDITVNNPACGQSDGLIDMESSTGNNNVFQWSNGSTTQDIGSLAPGTYYVTITKSNGCATVVVFTLVNEPPPTLATTTQSTTCGNNNGSVTLYTSGGTLPFVYAWSNGATTQSLTNLFAGTYTVTVTDGNGCTATQTTTVANIAGPSFSLLKTNATCGLNNGSITLNNFTGGTSPFTYVWSNAATTSSISNLGSGTYGVTVTDANGCTYTQSTNITNSIPPSLNTSVTNSTCGLNNGIITVNASNATAPYSYNWSNGNTTAINDPVAPGNYSVTVTSANGCTASASATVSAVPPPTLSQTHVNASCGNANGSINITVNNGTSPYTYDWSSGASTQNLSNLLGGTYTVTVTDANSCTAALSVVVTTTSAVSFNNPSTNDAGCGLSNGSATVQGTGSSPYTYLWSNGQTGSTATNLSAGTYSVTVAGANGCTASQLVNISNSSAPNLNTSVTNTTCNNANGSASVSVSGGSGSYTYLWSSGSTNTNATGLFAGNYTVTVTASDGCIATENATITNSPPPSFLLNPLSTTCGNANGNINLTLISGNNNPISYIWSNGSTTQDISNVSANTYSVTVTNGSGCTASQTITLTNIPGPTFALTPTNTICGLNNGVINSSVSGGTSPFSYLWSNGINTPTNTGLATGSYTLTVTDDNGCTASGSSTVNAITPPSLSQSHTNTTCGNSNGTISLMVNNGTAPFAYSWSNGATTQNLTGIAAATYSVTVTDANNCTATISVAITNAPSPLVSLVTSTAICSSASGSVSATVSSGTSPFTYLWSNAATTQNLSNVSSNSYSLTVTDANGCTVSSTASVADAAGPTIALSAANAMCGIANGNITSLLTDGTSPFSFIWSNGGTNSSIGSLGAGTYSITVTDANGCTATQSTAITASSAPTVSLTPSSSTCGNNNGSVNALVGNGTAPYTYDWSDGSTVQNISNVLAGSFTVTVYDANFCTASATAIVTDIPASVVTVSPITICNGQSGTLTATGSVNYTWSPSTALNSTSGSTVTANPIITTTYSVTGTDGNGCTYVTSTVVTVNPQPTISVPTPSAICLGASTTLNASGASTYSWSPLTGLSATSGTTVTANPTATVTYTVVGTSSFGCTNSTTVVVTVNQLPAAAANSTATTCALNNGTANVTATNGTAPYTYFWNNGATTSSINNLSPGSYSVTVTDAAGCTVTQSANVAASLAPQVILSSTNPTCALTNGSVSTSITQGTGPYTYNWSNGATTNNLTNVGIGNYSVTITTSIGCTATASTTLTTTQPPVFTATPAATTCGLNNGSISLSMSNGVSPYTFLWSNAATTSNTNSLAPGNYSVTVTDAVGCTSTASANIASSLVITATLTPSPSHCGNADGSIALSLTNGASPFSYAWSNASTTSGLANVLAGSYTVTVTDNIGCTATATTTITNIPGPTSIQTNPVNATCGINNGSITITGITGGTSPYSYSWSNGSTVASISNLNAGTYSITVSDANGCTISQSVSITSATAPTVSLSPTETTCGLNNGSISSSASNGTAPYTYVWSTGATTNTVSSLAPGSYSITVTDAAGCTATATTTVNTSQVAQVTLTPTNPTCALSNGSITSTITQATSPYSYVWSTAATTPGLTNVSTNTYSLTITDAIGCTATATTTLTTTQPPTASTSSIATTCALNNGSASVTASGGTIPYTYNWSNGSTNSSASNLSPGIYTVTVTDAVGCTTTSSATVSSSLPLLVSLSTTSAYCGNSDGAISSTLTNGTPPFTYVWSNAATTSALTNVPAGSYSLTVADNIGCAANATTTVANIAGPSSVQITASNATCGFSNGSITINSVTGGASPYTYLWSTISTAQTISGLGAGSYVVTVTDASGCSITQNAAITAATAPTVSLASADATCGLNNGSITSATSNGTSPYTYNWSNGFTSASINNLSVGTYAATITDAAGCTVSSSTSISNIPGPTATIGTTNSTCGNANGLVAITTSGGTSPLSFAWSNGATTQNISNVLANTYSVTITDANGCTFTATGIVSNTPGPNVSLSSSPSHCGNADGTVSSTVSNGTPPYNYLWSTGATTPGITNVIAGTYSITITDANGCTESTNATVSDINGPTSVQLTATNATCGISNGVATVAGVIGGTPSYTYVWDNASTSQSISGLDAGTYSVTVTDANGCAIVQSISITAATAPTLALLPNDATCGYDNGSVSATAANGTSPYAYNWSDGSTTNNISNLSVGGYTLTATDAAGCTVSSSISISNIPGPTATVNTVNETCTNANGTITLTTSGGTTPFSFAWSNGSTTQNVSNLSSNSYTVTITDANSCTFSLTTSISNLPAATVVLNTTNSTCGSANGLVDLVFGSPAGTSPYTFLWSNGATTQNINNVSAGSYSVTVTDANGCITSQTAKVSNTNGPSVALTPSDATCESNNGSVNAFVSGGTMPYSYLWSTGATTLNISNITSGNYTITVTDANGCTTSQTIGISTTQVPSVTVIPTATTCSLDNGSATAIGSNGTSPYTYVWNTTNTNQNINNLAPGNYDVTLTDAFGCTATASTSIATSSVPSISLMPTTATCGNANGSITISVSSGTSPYTYLWSAGSTTQDLTNILSGNYSVTVTDAIGCTSTASATVADTPVPVATLSTTDANCGQADGSVTLNISANGTAPYAFSWSSAATTQDLSNVPASGYTVTVTDALGCTTTSSAAVSNLSGPNVSATTTSSNCEAANGLVTTIISGGTPPLVFTWSNGATTQNLANVLAGNYTLTVSDANNCFAVVNATVDNNASPTTTAIPTPETCSNINGAVSLTVIAGGSSAFAYAWNNGNTNQNIANVSANTYSVTITDGNGCTASASATVVNEPSPTLSSNVVDETCGNANGSVSLIVSDGTVPFQYNWNNGLTTQNIYGLAAGVYDVTVTDANNCTVTTTVNVINIAGPTITLTPSSSTCGNGNGSVALTISQGTLPFAYAWSNGETSQDMYNIAGGVYSVTVTDLNGCTVASSITVSDQSGPQTNLSATNATCVLSNGLVDLTVSNGTAPFTYGWSNASTSQDLTNISDGNYNVTVTDANGCTAVDGIIVNTTTNPIATAATSDETCGNSNGSITLTIALGTAPFTFNWDNGSTLQNINGLVAGAYIITVTDALGCTTTSSSNIVNQPAPAISLTLSNETCGASNGNISSAIIGNLPFAYNWSNGFTTQDLNSITAGNYILTVTDLNGCTTTQSISVTNSPSPTLTANTTTASCGQSNGSVTLTVNGGTSPFGYSWDNGITTQNLNNVSAGNYSVTVTDSNNCTSTVTAAVSNSSGPTLTSTVSNTTCGNNDGLVDVTAAGGAQPLTFIWNNSSTTEDLNNVFAGTYNLTVSDDSGCIATISVALTDAAAPLFNLQVTDATCGYANGSIDLTVVSGNSPFTFTWSDGNSSEDLNNQLQGAYFVTVTDDNGCTASSSATINTTTLPAITFTTQDATCDLANGSIAATINNGTAPFVYNWDNGSSTQIITNLNGGTYNLTVTDIIGCTATQNATIQQGVSPTLATTTIDATCGQSNGLVNAIATGVTSPYNYLWSTGHTNASVSNISAGSYSVTVTDVSNCTVTATADVQNAGAPTLTYSVVNTTCNNANGSIDLTVSGNSAPYSFSWNNGTTTEDLSGISSGNYSVTVSDINSCEATATIVVNNTSGPTLSATAANTTCGNANGNVAVIIDGGTSPFIYNWNNGTTTQDLANISAGTYDVTVTDSNGCTTALTTTVINISGPSIIFTAVDASCGLNNGSINLSIANGTQPYTFAWSNNQSTQNISALGAGAYIVTVVDSNNCSAVQSITINTTSSPTLTTNIVDASCGSANGSIDLTVNSGASPYTYNWSNSFTSEDIANISANTYNVTVTDVNGCTATISANVSNAGAPVITLSATDATCQTNNGAITTTISGGTSPYTYMWSNTSSNQDIIGLASGVYTLTVTDASGCITIQSATINQPQPPTTSLSVQDATCGLANGLVDITVVNGTSPFVYSWNTTATTEDLSNISSGNYNVTITDASNCTVTTTANIISIPGPAATYTTTNSSCGNANGSIDLTVSSGTQPYSYNWANSATTEDQNGLVAGAYDVTITDINGCTLTHSIVINNANGPAASITGTNTGCNQSNGTASSSIIGGVAPYTYNWSNNATTQNISGLSAGTYTLTVTDANSCSTSSTVTISSAPCAITLWLFAQPSTCGQSNGGVSSSVMGGTAPYAYLWSNGVTNQNLWFTAPGIYSLTVTDANGITAAETTTITTTSVPAITATSQSSSCGQSNGSIVTTVTGGTLPYTYQWNVGGTSQNLNNISTGSYSLTVTDANGCTASQLIVIGTIGGPTISVSVTNSTCNNNNGSIASTVTNGTSPFNYNWSNGATTQNLVNVASGSYSVVVIDANGCTAADTATVTSTAIPSITFSTTATTCGNANGSVDLVISSGTSPYTYLWNNNSTTQDISNVQSGNYSVTVLDANNCSASIQASVSSINSPTITLTSTNTTCGNSNGSIASTISGGTAPFALLWSNGSTTQNINNISAGDYDLLVLDDNGCTATASATVSSSSSPSVTLMAMNSTCGNNDGGINATVTGGIQSYSYNWSNGFTSQNLVNVPAGNYSVTILDAVGCSVISSATINDVGGPTVSATSIDATCGLDNGSVNISSQGGTTPYVYAWDNGATTQNLINVLAGNYDVTLMDANGCIAVTSAWVNNIPGPTLSSNAYPEACGQLNGFVILTVNSGSAPFTYNWNSGSTTQNLNSISYGNYSVTVTDSNGCTAIENVLVDSIGSPQLIIQSISTFCNNANGAIDLTVTNGIPPYQYIWSNGASQQDLNQILAGNYSVIVIDDNGCTATASENVNATPISSVQLSSIPDSVCAGTIINVNAYGCIAYTWSPTIGLATSTGSSNTVIVSSSQQYTVTGFDANGCTTQATFNVTAIPQAVAWINGGPFSGCPPYTFELSSNNSNTSSIQWFVDNDLVATEDVTLTLGTGLYDVTLVALSPYGCNDTLSWPSYIEVYPTPDAGFTWDSVPGVVGQYEFTNTSTGAITYQWAFGDGGFDDATNPVYTYSNPSDYIITLEAINQYGCIDTAFQVLHTDWPHNVFIPNTFTPNGDGINDIFQVYGTGIETIKMEIYDRWGELVYKEKGDAPIWNGMYQGKPMNQAVFVYIADIGFWDGKVTRRVGDVTLLR